VIATPGPHGPRSRLCQPTTKFQDAPSSVSTPAGGAATHGRSRGTAGRPVPSSGAFGSRSPRPCMNTR
jgi:hypothetical protein